jgi:hypothetical protein
MLIPTTMRRLSSHHARCTYPGSPCEYAGFLIVQTGESPHQGTSDNPRTELLRVEQRCWSYSEGWTIGENSRLDLRCTSSALWISIGETQPLPIPWSVVIFHPSGSGGRVAEGTGLLRTFGLFRLSPAQSASVLLHPLTSRELPSPLSVSVPL